MVFILSLPICVHLIAMLVYWVKYEQYILNWPDYLVNSLFLVYVILFLVSLKYKSIQKQFALSVGTFLICFAAIEVCLRILIPSSSLRAPWIPMQRESIASETAMPGIQGKVKLSVNLYGLRGPDVDLDKSDLNILCVGGSTTECLYVTDEASWPWAFQTMLKEVLSKEVFVGNAGVSGHFSLNHLYLLEHYRYSSKFDWVIVYCGINDMGRLLKGDYDEMKESFVAEQTLKKKTMTKSKPYYYQFTPIQLFSFGRKVRLKKEFEQDPAGEWYHQVRDIRQKAIQSQRITNVPIDLNLALQRYKKDLKKILEHCVSQKQKLLFVTQATIYNGKDFKYEHFLTQHVDDQKAHDVKVLAEVMDAYNQTMIKFCKEEGVPCFDIASLLEKDTSTFYDDCHLNINGSKKFAELLSAYFLKLL